MPERLRLDAAEILLDLRENPTPPDSAPLRRDLIGRHRIRIDGWRIVYQINEVDRFVLILTIERRSADTYLNL